ncbi:ImmA/IrrE family metallo-endopeptidase, partial [Microvirga soli]|uniref:ImmA/IrrE family metallo-endopeptidase n=1 Tax=Microvirga soli TaxID=1854496 RepID=UPI001AEE37F4
TSSQVQKTPTTPCYQTAGFAVLEKKDIKEWSVEWQANTWAGYFLLPDSVMSLFDSVEEIVEMCKVDVPTAEFRLDQYRSKKRRMRGSEICVDCGGIRVLDRFGRMACGNCGS